MNMRVRPLKPIAHGLRAIKSIFTIASRARPVTPTQVRAGRRSAGVGAAATM